MKRLHIGVNLLWLVPGVVGGSEEYTTRLLAARLERPDDGIDVTLFVIRPFVDEYPDLVAAYSTVVCPISGRSKAIRIAAEASWLAVQGRRRRIDVMHHAGGTIPLVRATPSMLTIHDLQPLLLPDNFSRAKQTYLRWRLEPSARKSRLVVTLTEYTLATIVKRLGVPVDRVDLVAPGYTSALAEETIGDPAQKYDLNGPFFLYPAITYPHKNHDVLVRAFAELRAQHPDVLLVLTHRAAQMEGHITKLAAELGVTGSIRRLGHIDRGDLNWLYKHAVALTFPSRFEGFGLPVLEAMGHGCPVIAAAATALPEVVGLSGILLSPDDPHAWALAMHELMTDGDRREWLAEAGIARTAQFRWSESAKQLQRVFERAGEGLR
jgi:glycosyltransferase involved in cell wall biosynthesis